MTVLTKRLKYDYYTVILPGDLFESMEEFKDYAINEAREKAKLYVIPCSWRVKLISGEIGDWEIKFRVCRIRN